MTTYQGTEATGEDLATVSRQLGRQARGVESIAARSATGEPLVVATLPRLADGSPFPTTFYLTHPDLRAAISTLEAKNIMQNMNEQLQGSGALQQQYQRAHRIYLMVRAEIAHRHHLGDITEIAGISAGGMPSRVKCLHALVAQSLVMGKGVNVFGDQALRMLEERE